MARLKNNPELIEEIDRCAWYARLDRKVNETRLAILMQRSGIEKHTVEEYLLSRILDELT